MLDFLVVFAEAKEETYVALGNDRAGTGRIRADVCADRLLRLGIGEAMFMLILSAAVGAYLVYAMLRPEKF